MQDLKEFIICIVMSVLIMLIFNLDHQAEITIAFLCSFTNGLTFILRLLIYC